MSSIAAYREVLDGGCIASKCVLSLITDMFEGLHSVGFDTEFTTITFSDALTGEILASESFVSNDKWTMAMGVVHALRRCLLRDYGAWTVCWHSACSFSVRFCSAYSDEDGVACEVSLYGSLARFTV